MPKLKVFYNKKASVNSKCYSPSAHKPSLVAADWRDLDVEICNARFVKTEDFYLAHDKKFVDDILEGRLENGFGNCDLKIAKTFALTVGAMFSAARHTLINSQPIAAALCSGFHHAGYDFNGGFCTFNGLMITSLMLKKYGLAQKVGILDLDQHYGNGTDDIINRLNIDFVVHESPRVIESKAEKYLENLESIIRKKFKGCDIVLYQAGADSHVDDPLGGAFTTEQLKRRDQIVFSTLASMVIPVAFNLAGGYQKEEDGSIPKVLEIHRNTAIEAIKVVRFLKFRSSHYRVTKLQYPVPKNLGIKKIHIRNVRFSSTDLTVLENLQKIIEQDTGIRPSVTWVINRLMTLGIEKFEKQHVFHEDLIDEECQWVTK